MGRWTLTFLLLGTTVVACGPGSTATERPKIIEFVSGTPRVAPGATVLLNYQVEGADVVRIDTDDGEPILPSTPARTGEVRSMPILRTTTFVLTAIGPSADSSASVTVEVDPGVRPAVLQFIATPTRVDPGGSFTLLWETQNAASAEILADGERVHTIEVDALEEGTLDITPIATHRYVLSVRGEQGLEDQAALTVVLEGPQIRRFDAQPNSIARGDEATLSWEVENAERVEIRDGEDRVIYEGDLLLNSLSVRPNFSQSYALLAFDEDGAFVQTMTTVTVDGAPGALVLFFEASADTVELGDPVELSWAVKNAPLGVQLFAGTSTLTRSDASDGTLTVTPTATVDFRLVARHPEGDASALAPVVVRANGPAVIEFEATANPAALGSQVSLQWRALASTRVRLFEDGEQILDTTDTDPGEIQLPVSAPSRDYLLVAVDSMGRTDRRALTLYGHPRPQIVQFSATPADLMGPGAVALNFDVLGVSQLALYADGAPVADFPGVMSSTAAVDRAGSYTFNAVGSSVLVLEARSAAGQVARQRSIRIFSPSAEQEPNDSPMSATVLSDPSFVSASLSAGDVDLYQITVPQDGLVWARTSDGQGGCQTDTRLELLDQAGVLTSDEDGAAPCALIDPAEDPAAANLAAGVYWLRVSGEAGPYALEVFVSGPRCGDGVVAPLEACDLGDVSGGDGCSTTCQFEPQPTVVRAPGANVELELINPSAFGVIDIELLAPGRAIAARAVDPLGECSINTGLRLLDASGAVLGEKSAGGPVGVEGECAQIEYPDDRFALDLPPGHYRLLVLNEGSTTGQVRTEISIVEPVCGNGVLEAGVEECDDGNLLDLDLCDSACRVEALGTHSIPGSSAVTFNGSLAPGQVAIYRVLVQSEVYLRADAYSPVEGSCADNLSLQLRDPTRTLGQDNRGAQGSCATVDENLAFSRVPAGTYFVELRESAQLAVPGYALKLDDLPVGPGAPAVELEPNDTQADATLTALYGAGSVVVQGQTSPSGDDDVFALVVPAGQTLNFSARSFDQLGMPSACAPNNARADVRLFLEALGAPSTGPGTTELAFADNLSASLWCAELPGTVLSAAGGDAVYFLRVQHGTDAAYASYFIEMTLQ